MTIGTNIHILPFDWQYWYCWLDQRYTN